MVMMSLGMFVFDVVTLPYQSSQRQVSWRHPASSRVGDRPARQFVGPNDETRTLSGVLFPELTGGHGSLSWLEWMADAGEAYPLMNGPGEVLGLWVIESLDTTDKEMLENGQARLIDFSLVLKRVNVEQSALGGVGDVFPWLGLLS